MTSSKELLRQKIQQLSEEESAQTLDFLHRLQHSQLSPTLQRLKTDPAFTIPAGGVANFPAIDPIQGEGIPASQQLMEDRR